MNNKSIRINLILLIRIGMIPITQCDRTFWKRVRIHENYTKISEINYS